MLPAEQCLPNPRPEDWRLAGVATSIWAAVAAGTSGVSALVWAAVTIGVTVAVYAVIPRAGAAALAVLLGLTVGYFVGHLELQQNRVDTAVVAAQSQEKLTLLVRVSSAPQQQMTPWGTQLRTAAGTVLGVKVESVWWSSNAQVRLSGPQESLQGVQLGDTLVVFGVLREEFWGKPPMLGELRLSTVRVVAVGSDWERFTGEVRARMFNLTARLPQPAGALILGMSVGDRQMLNDEVRENMAVASLTHLTAISGTHIGLALAALAFVLPGGPLWRPAGMVLFLVFLVGVVGPTPSVLRATAMAMVAMVTLLRRRPTQPQVSLFLVLLTLVLLDPWIATQPGFIMSVLATGGILVSGRTWARQLAAWVEGFCPERMVRVRWAATSVVQIAAISTAASLWVLPPLVGITGRVPVWSVVANVAAAPAVAPVTLLGIGAALLSAWAPSVATILLWAAVPFAAWIAVVAQSVAAFPAATIPWPAGTWGVTLAAALVGLVVAIDVFRKTKRGGVGGSST